MLSLKILIVDDDNALCESLKSVLERHEYVIKIAYDLPTLFKMLESFQPDILFLSAHIPKRSGMGTLAEVKERYPAIRVVMMGEQNEEYERKARVLGADDFLVKPFTLEYLEKEVLEKVQRKAIRELKATFHELGVEREKMQLLFDQIREGVILLDTQGLLLIINRAAHDLLDLPQNFVGLTLKEALKNFKPSSLPAPRGYKQQELTRNPLDNPMAEHGEFFDLNRIDPPGLALETRISPLRTHAGEIEGSVIIFHDVTDQRRSVGAMKRMIGVLTHKFRTPLVSMIGMPKLLLMNVMGDSSHFTDGQKRALESIMHNSQRLDETINQLIGYTYLDPEDRESKTVPLLEIVEAAIEKISLESKEYASHTCVGNGVKALQIQVDPLRTRLAFENIVENAFKFGAKNLTIDARKEDGNNVVVQFIDDGPGIPAGDRAHIFDEFYQSDPYYTGQNEGTGLGLTLAKDIIEIHGGKIWVESTMGKGSTFYVRLPAAA